MVTAMSTTTSDFSSRETWIEKFHRESAEIASRRPDIEARDTERAAQEERRRMGIDERVRRVIAALPPELRGQPLPLSYFTSRMASKWRRGGQAHAGEVGGALTRLGWTRRRVWKSALASGRYPNLWHSPESD